MITAIGAPTWESALREFLLHREAFFRPNTVRYHRIQLTQLIHWAVANDVPFEHFGKRHMDQYTVYRREKGLSETTLRHDAVCAMNFQDWCVKNDLLDRALLSGYKAPKAARPFVYTPTDEEVRVFLAGIKDYWNPEKNPGIQFEPPTNRAFHRDRNYAFFFCLIDTACRIGELCSVKLGDYDAPARKITFRETKGKTFRTIPLSPECCTALEVWLKVRKRVTKELPPEEDEGWIFISEFGTRLDESRMNRTLHKSREFCGVRRFSPHGIRHYTLTKLSGIDLAAAQIIAGHKDPKTTMGYIDITEKRMREVHERAGIARSILVSKRPTERKRLI